MTNPSKLELLRLARELTGSTDIDALISSANKVSQYLGIPGVAPVPLHEKPTFRKFLELVQIQHPTRGTIPFKTYPFQRLLADRFEAQQFVVVNHARQLGISTITAAYVLWYATYHPGKTVHIHCVRYMHALEIMDRLRFMYESQTDLKQGVMEYNKGTIVFANGSKIVAQTVSSRTTRDISADLIVLDQAALVSHSQANDYWITIQPILNRGTRMIMTSTPKEDTGLFHQVYTGAPLNGFEPIELTWRVHPDRDDTWADAYRKSLGDDTFKQEFECKFSPAK